MGYMDQICSACQAGMCSRDHSEDVHDRQEDLRRCADCGEAFNIRSAKLGARCCPTCDRRAGRSW